MVYPPPAGGSGRTNTKPKPAPQKVAPQTTIRARPAPSTQVQKYSPPPPPPVTTSSSGQYQKPSPPPPPRQGSINPPGNQGGPVRNAAPRPGPGQRNDAIRRRQENNASPGAKAERGKGKSQPKPRPPSKIKAAATSPHAPAPVAPGPIQPPGLDQFLAGDVNYQSGMSGLMQELDKLKAWKLGEEGNVTSAYDLAKGRMEGERTKAMGSLKDDFASRGLLDSGLYLQAQSDYDTNYNQQLTDLTTDKQAQLQALIDQFGQGESENSQLLEALRLDAIRRRAEQYGITG